MSFKQHVYVQVPERGRQSSQSFDAIGRLGLASPQYEWAVSGRCPRGMSGGADFRQIVPILVVTCRGENRNIGAGWPETPTAECRGIIAFDDQYIRPSRRYRTIVSSVIFDYHYFQADVASGEPRRTLDLSAGQAI